MTDKPFDHNSVTCPMPGCGADLHLEWNLSRPLLLGDLDEIADPPAIEDAAVETWRVICSEGHVLLVPAHPYVCPCGAEDCNHDQDTDEVRRFRAHDLVRLQDTITTIAYRPRRMEPSHV